MLGGGAYYCSSQVGRQIHCQANDTVPATFVRQPPGRASTTRLMKPRLLFLHKQPWVEKREFVC